MFVSLSDVLNRPNTNTTEWRTNSNRRDVNASLSNTLDMTEENDTLLSNSAEIAF